MRPVLPVSVPVPILAATVGLFLVLVASSPLAAGAACPPRGESESSLRALKADGFAIESDSRRNQLARALVACLGDPDPKLRDGVAYEAYATWLRAEQLDSATRRHLLEVLSAALAPAAVDADGFRQPFAALVMSEVARTDRVTPWLTLKQRVDLVETAARYVESVRDYRGYDARDGWRHGVAHGADLLMQLALNPTLEKPQLDRILAAVAAQVAPAGEHAYVDGESERLARPLLFVAQRGLHDEAEWQAWFGALVAPAPLASWQDAFASRTGLAKRHNLLMFLRTAYVGAREGGDAKFEVLLPHLRAAMKALP
jgi:hypothetical protein